MAPSQRVSDSAFFAFAPTMTPISFVEPTPPPVSPPTSLCPLDLCHFSPPHPDPALPSPPPSSRRTTHGRRRGEDHIPRPPNAFILFRSSFIKSQHVSSEVETNHSTLSKIIGLMWQNMPHEERQLWHAKAKKALEDHRRRWPQYAFRPAHSKARGAAEKRKVREVEPKDMKRCAKIAQLLAEGKKGAELDIAIQEFDRTHVPEIVTRFETPITARSFRRSSSAPVDSDQPKKSFLPDTSSSSPAASSPTASSRRIRSCSSESSLQPPQFTQHVPRQPHPLAPSVSYSDLSVPHQPSLELDPYVFDMVLGDSVSPASDLASYPCSPIAAHMDAPSFCFPTGYSNGWTPSSSPMPSLPPTPQALSPLPALDHAALDDPFSMGQFSIGGLPGHGNDHSLAPCPPPYPAGYHHGFYLDGMDTSTAYLQADQGFGMYGKESFGLPFGAGGRLELAGVDPEFSTFMSSLSEF